VSRLFSLTSSQITNCEVAIARFKVAFGTSAQCHLFAAHVTAIAGLDSDQFHYTGKDERLETVLSLSSIARPAAHNPLTFWLLLDA
jgi:hypothetical protein